MNNSAADLDILHMRHALMLARRGLGQVWPNPAVGCVLVRDGVVVGRGWTQPGGRPHAEAVALSKAKDAACGSTAYVTLEPCSHHGKTPPCSDALIAAGVRRVVVACLDPDPRVNGNGIQKLRDAGIHVDTGLLEAEARRLNIGFLHKVELGRPFIHMKIATTLDGYTATATGHSQWITGDKARQEGHRMRSEADAILTGSGTLAADDPMLTVRLPGLDRRQPVRIVLEGETPVSEDSKIWSSTATSPVWLITCKDLPERTARLAGQGVRTIVVPDDLGKQRPDIASLVKHLAQHEGMTRLFVEAGSTMNAAFLKAGLVDRLSWFRAPTIMGGDGLPGIAPLQQYTLDNLPQFRLKRRLPLDMDVLEDYESNR